VTGRYGERFGLKKRVKSRRRRKNEPQIPPMDADRKNGMEANLFSLLLLSSASTCAIGG